MIKAIEIKNFRSCKKTTLQVNTAICALAGKNGVGKTNILQAVAWYCDQVVRTDVIRVDAMSSASGTLGFSLKIEIDAKLYELKFDYKRFSKQQADAGEKDHLFESITNISDNQELIHRNDEEVKLYGRAEPIQIGYLTPAIAAMSSLLPEADPIGKQVVAIKKFLSGIAYYSASQTGESNIHISNDEFENALKTFNATGKILDSLAFRMLYMERERPGVFLEFQQLIGENGLGLISVKPAIAVKLSDESTSHLNVYLLTPLNGLGGSGDNFVITQLSAGTLRVLNLVASLLVDNRSTMLVEEPEGSIHPGLFNKLLDIWRSYSDKARIIFTTHAPYVFDILRPEEVRLVTAPAGKTIARELSQSELKTAAIFLQDEGKLSDYLETLED